MITPLEDLTFIKTFDVVIRTFEGLLSRILMRLSEFVMRLLVKIILGLS